MEAQNKVAITPFILKKRYFEITWPRYFEITSDFSDRNYYQDLNVKSTYVWYSENARYYSQFSQKNPLIDNLLRIAKKYRDNQNVRIRTYFHDSEFFFEDV